MARLTHISADGEARMVDVSGKEVTKRTASAEAWVRTTPEVIQSVRDGAAKKGDVLAVCRVAGIMAAKKTSDLIPLCHPLPIDSVDISIDLGEDHAHIVASASTTSRTGLEMEVITAVSIAAVTFYDMCKAMDRDMSIESVRLLEKSGGKSGTYKRNREE